MKKKNLVIVALASAAFAIAGGAALTSSMLPESVGVEASPVMDGTKLNYVQVLFQLSDIDSSDRADDYEGAYYYLSLTGGAKNTTGAGIELFHQPGEFKSSAVIDVSEYVGWTSVKVNRGSSTGDIWQSTAVKNVAANTKNFFKFTYGGNGGEYLWWRNEGSEERFATIEEYAVIDGVAETEAFATQTCWNNDSFAPTSPVRVGYDFSGWFTDAGCTSSYTAGNLAHDTKLYAKFVAKPWSMRGKGAAFPDKDGDGNTNFDADDALAMVVNNASEVMIQNITLTAGDVFEFTDGTKWLGWSDVKPGTPDANPINACFKAGANDNNIEVVNSGTYTFYVDVTKESGTANSIWITQQAYVDIDGWSDGFNKVTDFCDIGDTDWATYAASFAELDPDAQDIFNKATANASGNNIQKAAARYDYAVGTKGKTAFAGGSRAKNALFISPMRKGTDNGGVAAVAVTATIGVGAAVGLIFLRRRRVL